MPKVECQQFYSWNYLLRGKLNKAEFIFLKIIFLKIPGKMWTENSYVQIMWIFCTWMSVKANVSQVQEKQS